MKRTVNSVKTASLISPDIIAALFTGLLLPLLILAGFGAFSVYQQGYGIYFVGLLAVVSLLSVVPMLLKKKKQNTDDELSSDAALVKPSGDWGQHDHEVWEKINQQIQNQLEQNDDWGELKEHALELVAQTSKEYGRKELAFSLPELLKMTEEISRRYRKILLTHAPFVEKIPYSLYKFGYEHQEEARKGLKISSWLFDAYRMFRITTPAGIISEIRSKILGETFGSIGGKLQYQLKQALLQEVISVSIDLYSGRFNIDDTELAASQTALDDYQRMAAPLEPLRVCLIGQVSSGKSSIVNALKKELSAETSQLPSTNKTTVYQCSVEGMDTLHLIDLPGLDGTSKTDQQLLTEATRANVILWVFKASQPARALDIELKRLLDDYYLNDKHRSKKAPVIIGVLNQVDLLKPINIWQPPYDPDNPDTPKARIISEALEYNKELMAIENMLPLSVSKDRETFNLNGLEKLLDKYFDEGMQVQLNQRRIEAGEHFKLTDQAKRVYQSGKSLFSLMKN